MTDGGIDPRTAWDMYLPDVHELLDAWAAHPPLRVILSHYVGVKESRW